MTKVEEKDRDSVFNEMGIPQEYYLNQTDFVIGDEVIFFNTLKFELVPYVGCLVHIENAEYPHKVFPRPEGIHAINMVKSMLRQYTSFPVVFLFPTKLAKNFIWFFRRCFFSFMVKRQYMCHASYNFYKLLEKILANYLQEDLAEEVAYSIAHIIEYDDAYRSRLQDMATECNLDNLKRNPRKEISRLFDIMESRERPGVFLQTRKYKKLIMLALLLPGVRKAFKLDGIYFKNMQYDKSDWYWVAFKDDYKFGGKTHEERLAEGIKVPFMYSSQ